MFCLHDMGSTTIIDKFVGEGFHTWQVRIKYALMKESLWAIVSGREECPEDINGKKVWMNRDEKGLAIIALGLSDTFIHHIVDKCTSKEAWDELEKLFGAKGKNSKISLKIQFFGLELKRNETLSAHINTMKSIMAQLACIGAPVEEEDGIAILLKSMKLDEYGPLVATLKNLPDPTFQEIEAALMEEEQRLKKTTNGGTPREEAFFHKGPRRSQELSGPKGKMICFYCGKVGHMAKDCWHKKRAEAANLMVVKEENSNEGKESSQEEGNPEDLF